MNKTKIETKIEIPEDCHPFVGAGKGIIITDNNREKPRIRVVFPLLSVEITTAEGEKARKLIKQIILGRSPDDIMYAISVACRILSIEISSLYMKTKKERPVFARWLIWHYAIHYLNMQTKQAASLFSMNHATVLNGVDKLREEKLLYLSPWQKRAYDLFWKEMNEYNLLSTKPTIQK